MIFNGTWFNVDVVLTMTKKQFQLIGGRGNNINPEELGKFYDMLKNKDDDYIKYAKSNPVGGRTRGRPK